MIQSLAIVILASGFFLFFKANLPRKIFSEEKPATTNVVIDNLLLEAIEEEKIAEKEEKTTTTDTDTDQEEGAVLVIQEEDLFSNEGEASFKGMVFLDYFFSRLYQVESQNQGRARIAYYGDSMTDGDMIVQDLRKNYQDKYGGSGVGFIQITSESAQSRGSVTHKYSPNWKVQSYLNVKNPRKPFGIGGQVFFIKDTIKPTWVSYQAGNIRNMTTLNNPTLYYGRSTNTKGTVEVIMQKDTLRKSLQAVAALNKLKLTGGGSIKQLKLQFLHADSIPLYGIDVSSPTGVQVDNFSSRGNSGLPLSLFNVSIMQKFQKELDYSLIILHYGTNVLNYGSYNYSWYTKQMNKVVSHLRQCFPKASILVISTADKATKYNLTMETDSAVTPLMRAQRKYAMESKTGFFNLYEAMGGKGSMVQWVEESPAKANKDYTHFNFRGAQTVSTLIFKQLEEGYAAYKKEKGEEPVQRRGIKEKEDSLQKKKVQKEIDTVSNDEME